MSSGNFEGILTQGISSRTKTCETVRSPYLKNELVYLISGSICFPFASTALDIFIVARNDAIKIQVDECARCLPGQIWRGSVIERFKRR